jgi:hypothetical protein
LQRESTDFYVKFLVCLILSPSVPISVLDINSSISATRRKQIAKQLAEAGFLTYIGKTKGKRWMMSEKLHSMLSQLISIRPEVLVELAGQAVKIKIRGVEMSPPIVGATQVQQLITEMAPPVARQNLSTDNLFPNDYNPNVMDQPTKAQLTELIKQVKRVPSHLWVRRAAEVFNGRPKGFYTTKNLTYDIKDACAIYYTLARLEERGLVAVPLRLRPREWHRVSWSGGVPSIDALKGRVVRMCTKHHPEPLLLKTKGQVWQLPNPVIRITACP